MFCRISIFRNALCNFTEQLMLRLIPASGYIQSVLELESCSDADRPRTSKTPEDTQANMASNQPKRMRLSEHTEESFLPNLKPKVGTELQLTIFPEKNYPEGSTPSEITKHTLDLSFTLEAMLTKYSE